MHKSRRKYYNRRSAQTPRPTEEPRGQEGQVQHSGNREKRQEAKDPLNHPESKVQPTLTPGPYEKKKKPTPKR